MISLSHWISLAVATSFGVILGYVVGKHSEKKKTCIATKEKPEASEKDEVLFFPDSLTYAGKYGCDNCVWNSLWFLDTYTVFKTVVLYFLYDKDLCVNLAIETQELLLWIEGYSLKKVVIEGLTAIKLASLESFFVEKTALHNLLPS